MNKVVPSDFGRGCILLTLQELRFVWSESEELMLEFAESVPFYGNMGRPQVDMGLSSKDQGSNGSNGNKTHHQQLWWESQMSSSRFGKCNSKFSKGSDFGKCCSMLFSSSLCKISPGFTPLVSTMESTVVAQHFRLCRLHLAGPWVSCGLLPGWSGQNR